MVLNTHEKPRLVHDVLRRLIHVATGHISPGQQPGLFWWPKARPRSVVAQLGDRTVMQPALMGMALSPGHFLGVDIGGFTAIGGGMALRHNRLMTPLLLLAVAHPLHKQGLTLGGAAHGFLHTTLTPSFCSGCYGTKGCSIKRDLGSGGHRQAPGHR